VLDDLAVSDAKQWNEVVVVNADCAVENGCGSCPKVFLAAIGPLRRLSGGHNGECSRYLFEVHIRLE